MYLPLGDVSKCCEQLPAFQSKVEEYAVTFSVKHSHLSLNFWRVPQVNSLPIIERLETMSI